MSKACSGTQANDRFGIVLDFVTKLHNGTVTEMETKRFLRHENPFGTKKPLRDEAWPVPPLFYVKRNKQIDLPSIHDKRTIKEFFADPLWAYSEHREGRFDQLFSESLGPSDACTIACLYSLREAIPAEIAAQILRINEGIRIADSHLCELLIAGGYTITLPQIEMLIRRAEISQKDGGFFFVRTNSREKPVISVVVGFWNEGGKDGWTANYKDLGNDLFCSTDSHCFFRGERKPY